jgi:hypothetical protein
MAEDKNYCLDANIFIEGWNKYYSMELSTGYWEILDSFAQKGRVFSPIEVKREILRLDDGLTGWLKERPYFFREITTEVQVELQKIMAAYPRLVDSIKQRSIADPWVIAFAITEKAIVVTKEEPVGSSSKRIKIPDVCNELSIPWINDFQFARELGIHFTAHLTT